MKRILLVDDDKDILSVLEETLTYSSYYVKSISNSEKIFEIIADYKPDLVILDFLLDDENGGEICFKLKKSEATAHLPVILLSGFASLAEMQSIYGCDAYLAKPFDIKPLLLTVKNCIEKADLTNQLT